MEKLPRNPFLWVPTLYLAMGIPYNLIMAGSGAANMYKSLGLTNSEITVSLGGVAIAWSAKPFWAAFLDMYRTKKFWVLSMEALLAALFVGVAMSIGTNLFLQTSLALFWVAAFASSTQDICADGIYLTSLDKPRQAKFAGLQGTFWTTGKVLAAGGFIFGMTKLQAVFNWSEAQMWQGVMIACGGSMLLLFAWHYFFLPQGSITERPHSVKAVFKDFGHTAVTFFHKRAFWGMMAFVCLYRLGEGLIMIEGQLFLRSATMEGGLGMSAAQVSKVDAIYGTIASIAGGLLGGWFAGKRGLSRSLWIMGLCLNVPHFTYVALSHVAAAGNGASYGFIASMVCLEKFGYGFGMVGNMIYMMQQLAPGRRTMTHYAFATALMNLMLVPTQMISGPLAELLGFSTFFILVMFASVPSVWAAFKAPFPLADEDKTLNGGPGNVNEVITVDDPTRLSAGELLVQKIAGRASMFAILNVLSLLAVDTMLLGRLHGIGADRSAGQIYYAALVACSFLKVWFSWKAVVTARVAIAEADAFGEKNYRGNARGAIVATLVCAALSVAVLFFGAKMVP